MVAVRIDTGADVLLGPIADPVMDSDAANKRYVDAQVAGVAPNAGITVQDDGTQEGTGIRTVNFGANLDVTVSGTTATIAGQAGGMTPQVTLTPGSNITVNGGTAPVTGAAFTIAANVPQNTNTTYTFVNGTAPNTFQVTPSGGSPQIVTVPPAATTVATGFDNSTRVLTTTVDGVVATATIPVGDRGDDVDVGSAVIPGNIVEAQSITVNKPDGTREQFNLPDGVNVFDDGVLEGSRIENLSFGTGLSVGVAQGRATINVSSTPDMNTRYTFSSGTDGTFSVSPSDTMSPQTVSVGTLGTVVDANPSVPTNAPALTSISIAGSDYRIVGGGGAGTTVVGNPTTPVDSGDLTRVTIGSDTYNIPTGSSGPDTRPIIEQIRSALFEGDTNRVLVTDASGDVTGFDYTVRGDTVTARLSEDNFDTLFTYSGGIVSQLAPRMDLVHRFIFSNAETFVNDTWELVAAAAQLLLRATANGLLERVMGDDTEASVTENGELNVTVGYTVTENGEIMEI